MKVYRATDLLKATRGALDRGKLHVEKREVHLPSGQTIQANRWVAPEDVTKLTPSKAPKMEPILSQKQPASGGQEGKGEHYQPKLPGMPSSKLRIEDVPPEKRFDTVWIMRSKEVVDFGPDNKTVVQRLMALQRAIFGEQAGQGGVPEERAIATASAELQDFLDREKEGMDIGRGWYTTSQDKARASLTAMYPSLADDAQWDFMCLLISVSSPKHSPDRNLRVALQWYEHFLDRGEVLPLHPTTGKAWGLAGQAIRKKAEQINKLLKEYKGDVGAVMAWLRQPSTVGEVRREAKRLGIDSPEIVGKKNDPVDMRARMFGHKFSAFYENISGGVARSTIDTWAIRSYQRWHNAVQPFLNSQGNIEVNVKVPLSIKYEIEELFKKLGERFGLFPKQVQSILWYYEKRLYDRIDTEERVTKKGKPITKRRGGNNTIVSFMEVAKEIFDERTAGINPFAEKVGGRRGRTRDDGRGAVPELPGVAQGDGGSVGGQGQGASLGKAESGRGRPRLALLKHKYLARLGGPGDWRYLYKWPGQDKPPQKLDRIGLGAMTTPMGDADHHHRSASTKRPVYYRNVGRGGDKVAVQARPAEVDEPKTLASWEQELAERESAIRQKAEEALARVNASKAAMFRSPGRSYYYILHPSTRRKGAWQVSVFDAKDTPTGHFEFDTAEEACHSVFGGGKGAAIGDRSFEMVHVSKALMIVNLWKARRGVRTIVRRKGATRGTERNWKIQGHVDFQGLKVSIENALGTVREGTDADGKHWQTLMRYPYGYIQRSEGTDGDHVDCYIGPRRGSSHVFIVHQNNPKTGKYDEDKTLIGFETAHDAREAYLAQYDDPAFFGSMEQVTMDQFKEMLKNGRGVKLKKTLLHKGLATKRSDMTHETEYNPSLKKGQLDATHPEMHHVGGPHPHTQVYHVGRKEPEKLEGHEVLNHMGDRGDVSGGGGALKIRLVNGSLAVMKYGDNVGQLHDENTANAVYAIMGIKAHRSKIMSEGGKPVLVSDWIEGYTPYSELDEDDQSACRYALHEGFVTDALLANWDVLGLSMDNIFYKPESGETVRIDNGGALRYSAMGNEKGDKFKDYVGELKNMRDPARKASRVFGDVTRAEITKQIERIQQKREAILNVIDDPALRAKMAKRIDSLSAMKAVPLMVVMQKALHPEKRTVRRKTGKTFQQTFHIADQKAKLVVGRLGSIYDTLPRTPLREEIARRKRVEAAPGNPVEKRRDQKAHFDRIRKLGVRPMDSVIAEIAVGATGLGPKAVRAAWAKMDDKQKAALLAGVCKTIGLPDTAKKIMRNPEAWWTSAKWVGDKVRAHVQSGGSLDPDIMESVVCAVDERSDRLMAAVEGAGVVKTHAEKTKKIVERVQALMQESQFYVPAGLRMMASTAFGVMLTAYNERSALGDVKALDFIASDLTKFTAQFSAVVAKAKEQGEARAKIPVDAEATKETIDKALTTCDGYSAKLDVEHMIVVGRDGKVLGEETGTNDSIDAGDATPYLYAHALVHNHPKLKGREDEFTLSGVDLKFANMWRMNRIYAITSGTIFCMEITTHYPAEFFSKALKEAAAAIVIKRGVTYPEDQPAKFQREYVKLIAKQCGWKYTETKRVNA